MNREEAIKKLVEIQEWHDTELAHIAADNVLCDLLVSLGCEQVVTEFNKIDMWYA